ncbi:MAG: GtrA family protein [Dehalococcoidia bacterium]|nr:GtrA family protein [Dehalococcoidia bacterium]
MAITSADRRTPASSLADAADGIRLAWALRPWRARVLRFATTGALSGLSQVGLLALLLHLGLRAWPANMAAFATASQANFALSNWFTWGDRRRAGNLASRWLRFMSTITLTALLNLGVFTFADAYVSSLLAACLGIAVAAGANFVVADRAVFVRDVPSAALSSHERGR